MVSAKCEHFYYFSANSDILPSQFYLFQNVAFFQNSHIYFSWNLKNNCFFPQNFESKEGRAVNVPNTALIVFHKLGQKCVHNRQTFPPLTHFSSADSCSAHVTVRKRNTPFSLAGCQWRHRAAFQDYSCTQLSHIYCISPTMPFSKWADFTHPDH